MEWVDFWITGALKKIWFFLTTEFEFKEDDPPRYIFADKKKGFVFVTKKNKKQHDYSFC